MYMYRLRRIFRSMNINTETNPPPKDEKIYSIYFNVSKHELVAYTIDQRKYTISNVNWIRTANVPNEDLHADDFDLSYRFNGTEYEGEFTMHFANGVYITVSGDAVYLHPAE